jgi:hypothetical protein
MNEFACFLKSRGAIGRELSGAMIAVSRQKSLKARLSRFALF